MENWVANCQKDMKKNAENRPQLEDIKRILIALVKEVEARLFVWEQKHKLIK